MREPFTVLIFSGLFHTGLAAKNAPARPCSPDYFTVT